METQLSNEAIHKILQNQNIIEFDHVNKAFHLVSIYKEQLEKLMNSEGVRYIKDYAKSEYEKYIKTIDLDVRIGFADENEILKNYLAECKEYMSEHIDHRQDVLKVITVIRFLN